MRRRVVITGMGLISPLGHSVDDLFRSQIEGRSGVGPITLFNAGRFPTRFAAQVKNFDLGKYVTEPQRWADSGANSRFAAGAAQQALADAELLDNSSVDRTRIGVYLGSGEGIQDFHNLVSLVAQTYQPARRASIRRRSPVADCATSTPAGSTSRSCTRLRHTWPRISICRGRTTIA